MKLIGKWVQRTTHDARAHLVVPGNNLHRTEHNKLAYACGYWDFGYSVVIAGKNAKCCAKCLRVQRN